MAQKHLIALLMALATSACLANDLPNPQMTPGALNPDVTQANISTTICVRGWSRSVRPPAYYTNRLKKRQLREYGYQDINPRDYEEDHLIPLSVGGNPTDPRNLWPEPRKSEWNAKRKDKLEFALYKAVCRGTISLDEARQAFATNWISAFQQYKPLLERHQYRYRGR